MAERTREVEERLSDALHERLTQRFVDRRTSVLLKDIGRKGVGEFPVIVDEQGEVTVGSFPIGRLEGFAFEVDPTARHADRKMLLATAERRLGGEYEKRAAALAADTRRSFHACAPSRASRWRCCGAATRWLGSGRARICSARGCSSTGGSTGCPSAAATIVVERLDLWVRHQVERSLGPLRAGRAGGAGAGGAGGGPLDPGDAGRRGRDRRPRGGGQAARRARQGAAAARSPAQDQDRRARPVHARRAQARGAALAHGAPRRRGGRADAGAAARIGGGPPLPADGERRSARPASASAPLGPQMLRVDLVERLARHAHEARAGKPQPVGRRGARHLARPSAAGGGAADARPRLPARRRASRPGSGAAAAPAAASEPRRPRRRRNAFAALAGLKRG